MSGTDDHAKPPQAPAEDHRRAQRRREWPLTPRVEYLESAGFREAWQVGDECRCTLWGEELAEICLLISGDRVKGADPPSLGPCRQSSANPRSAEASIPRPRAPIVTAQKGDEAMSTAISPLIAAGTGQPDTDEKLSPIHLRSFLLRGAESIHSSPYTS